MPNAVAHAEGLSDGFAPATAYWANRSAETEKPMRDLLTLETTRFQYLHGQAARNRTLSAVDGQTGASSN